MKGTVQLDISNATEEAPIESELLDIGGFKCQLRYPESGYADDVIWVAFSEECQDRLWLCKVKFSFEEMTTNGQWKMAEWKPDYRFPHTSFPRKFHCKKPNAIKVHVDILWAANEANLPVLDTDLVLKMGEKSEMIPVNKFCLAMHSGYFRDLFFGEWQDDAGMKLEEAQTGRKQYTIQKDASFQLWQFRYLLYGTHVFGCRLNEHPDLWQWRQHKDHEELNIELLRMAVKYRLPLFVEFTEQLLIKSGSGTMAMLEVADQLNLEKLKSHCLNSIDLIEYGKQFAKNKKIHALLEDETRKALDAKLEESANKIKKPVFY